jgi:hypothetical protein
MQSPWSYRVTDRTVFSDTNQKRKENNKLRSDFRLFTIPYADQFQAMQKSCWVEQKFTLWYHAKLTVQHWNFVSAVFKWIPYLPDDNHIIISAHKEWKRILILHKIQNTVPEYKECPLYIRVRNYVRLFVCFPGVTTHCGCIFTAR